MKAILFLTTLLLCSRFSYSQGGYLGAKNGLEIEVYTTPSFKKATKLNHDATTTTVRNRFGYVSYAVTYSRVMDKNIEFNFKYRYAKATIPFYRSTYLVPDTIYTPQDPQDINNKVLNFLEDAGTSLHFFTLGFKHYRFGSFAPLGKYLGAEFEYGFSTLRSSQNIYVGKGDVATVDNFLITKKDVLEIDTIHAPKNITGKVNSFNFLIGRSYPVTDFLLLTVGAKIPIFSLISFPGYFDLGQGAQKSDPVNYSTSSNFQQIIRLGMGKFTRMTVNFGLKLTF